MVSIIRTPNVNERPRRVGARRVVAALGETLPAAEAMEGAAERTAAAAQDATQRLITLEEYQAQEKALREMQRRAEAAENKLAEYDEVLEALREDARSAGHRAGYDQGLAAGAADAQKCVEAQLARVGTMCQQLQQEFEGKIAAAVQDGIVELVFTATTRILGDELVRAEGVEALVKRMAAEVMAREQYVVRVSPQDFELLNRHGEVQLGTDHGSAVKLLADERVKLGGCIVETTSGSLDGRLETQLQRLKEVLLDVRAQRLSEEAD